MNKTVGSVIEDINEWENPRGGSVFYVTCIFTDETVGSVGRKDHDAALEVQGLLRESIGTELDFTLEPKGQTKTGRDKFKILGFGTPGGAATYTAPGVQGGGAGASASAGAQNPGRGRSPEPFGRSPEHFAAEAALNAAVTGIAASGRGLDAPSWRSHGAALADEMYAWMLEKTSEPAPSAYQPNLSVSTPADVGSEDSAGDVSSSLSDPAGSGEGLDGFGEGQSSPPHEHDWQMRQGVRSHLVCDCGATRKRETATK